MPDTLDDTVKILFRFYSPVLEKWTVERLWAKAIDIDKGWYQLDNIPFYVLGIAYDDAVFAEWDATEEALTFREVIRRSGNSTIQVVIMNAEIATNDVRAIFDKLGCETEKFKEGYFVINVPAAVDYATVLPRLSVLFMKKVLDYAEAFISDHHLAATQKAEKPKIKPRWRFW